MSQRERWYFWKSKPQRPAGVSELERSESSLTPATPPAEGGPAEPRRAPSTANDPVVPPAPVDQAATADAGLPADADAEVNDSLPPIEAAGRTPTMADAGDLPEAQRETAGPPAADAELDPDEVLEWEGDPPVVIPNLGGRKRGTLSKPIERRQVLSPQQKLLLLDTWLRSGLPARDFGAMVNISRHTLYSWKQRFERLVPLG